MTDAVVVDGDVVNFLPTFGAATVVPVPTTISGTAAKTLVTGKAACLEGDEQNVQSPNCAYTKGAYVGGMGTLKIDKLASDQLTETTLIEGKKAILKGSQFDAVFEVTTPAQQPGSPPTPDAVPQYTGGKGSFVASNTKVLAK